MQVQCARAVGGRGSRRYSEKKKKIVCVDLLSWLDIVVSMYLRGVACLSYLLWSCCFWDIWLAKFLFTLLVLLFSLLVATG